MEASRTFKFKPADIRNIRQRLQKSPSAFAMTNKTMKAINPLDRNQDELPKANTGHGQLGPIVLFSS